MFPSDPLSRPPSPPASSSPLRDYLASTQARANTGVDPAYAVLPRVLVESMPLPWQQQMVHLLAEFHQATGHRPWPLYRVVPSRSERLVDLDEEQLAEIGALVEIDAVGEIVYRERNGRRIEEPEQQQVLVACPDPLTSGRPAPGRGAATPAGGIPEQGDHAPAAGW
ncbi:hypothetical protein C1701_05810 [Actinoalloteichus sp. AHMU CJ021]|uniref:Uncharacterized protein n=1 Tax=Actinoalloteichus caeruleus DSM 43889 TaxID=1120930 RepID=A0ABT1JHG4_ACTCY|nr:hypothetical protein [Actinoalloteichus caeruleus]AUS77969.1 hypothetical protein C1701_05810 [Actinoalloteichus sp. AHMU CJ021]MCP2331942.1 hypothetical protein [Actinoalloteichus caeruleus DSM 43889]